MRDARYSYCTQPLKLSCAEPWAPSFAHLPPSLVKFFPLDPTDESNVNDLLITVDNTIQYGEDLEVRTESKEDLTEIGGEDDWLRVCQWSGVTRVTNDHDCDQMFGLNCR